MKKGFTFIEILITLTAILTLIGLFVYFIKPVEIFKRNRDFQRINDLRTLEIAIETYLANSNKPDLDGYYYSTGYDEQMPAIYISIPRDQIIATSVIDGVGKEWQVIQNASDTSFIRRNDGLGWIPINFTELKNPPLNYLPVDPINNFNYFYSYAFSRSNQSFELNAKLESDLYNIGGDQDKASTDGGSDNEVYEAGTNKCLIIGNKLYGNISTTTCAQTVSFQFPKGYLPQSPACTNPQKITVGEWLLFDSNDNLIATDTASVHDGSTSTSLWISTHYLVHKLPMYYFLSFVKLYSDYGSIGNKPSIKYYKNSIWMLAGDNETRNCSIATTTSINTTTIAWAVGWGSNVTVCEMEAYGCPIQISWFRSLGKNIYLFDLKSVREKYLFSQYVITGSRKINEYTYPYFAKIDLEGNIIASSTINISGATTSYFNIIQPIDDDQNGYIDNYLVGGIKQLENQDNSLVMKISNNLTQIWSQELPNTYVRAFELNNNGNYIGVGKKDNQGYFFVFNSSTGAIMASTTLATSSIIFDDVKDIKSTTDGFIIIGLANNKPIIAKIDSNGNVLKYLQFECYLNLISIKKTPLTNVLSILVKQPIATGNYFYTINIASDLSIVSLKDVWNSKEVTGQDVCTLAATYNFKIFQNLEIADIALNSDLAGLGNESGQKIVFVKNGFINYPLSVYLDSTGFKIIKNYDLGGYLAIGFENKIYGGFVIQLTDDGQCLNCFSRLQFYYPFANILQLFRELPKFILRNLQFLP